MYITFLYIAILLSLASVQLHSRDIYRRLCSQNEVVFKSIDSSLFVLKTDYLLEGNSGQEYGFKGGNIFGSNFFVGLNIDGNILLPGLSQKPWVLDSNYKEFATIDTLKPKISKINLFDISAKEVHRQDSMMEIKQYGQNLCYFQMPIEYPSLKVREEQSDSWIVLISFNEEKFKKDTIDIVYNIYKEDFDFMKGHITYLDSALLNDITLIGGAVYGVKYVNGSANFYPTAVLYFNFEEKKWLIEKLYKGETSIKPINKKNQENKQSKEKNNPWWKFWLWF